MSRRFQFSLKWLLLGIVPFSVWLSAVSRAARTQREVVAMVESKGGLVFYRHQIAGRSPKLRMPPVTPPDCVVEYTMNKDNFKRTVRSATSEELDRQRLIREQVQQDLPELNVWARAAAARHQERIGIGTVLCGEETKLVRYIDDYAAKHSLAGRGAVVREALAQLLGVELDR